MFNYSEVKKALKTRPLSMHSSDIEGLVLPPKPPKRKTKDKDDEKPKKEKKDKSILPSFKNTLRKEKKPKEPPKDPAPPPPVAALENRRSSNTSLSSNMSTVSDPYHTSQHAPPSTPAPAPLPLAQQLNNQGSVAGSKILLNELQDGLKFLAKRKPQVESLNDSLTSRMEDSRRGSVSHPSTRPPPPPKPSDDSGGNSPTVSSTLPRPKKPPLPPNRPLTTSRTLPKSPTSSPSAVSKPIHAPPPTPPTNNNNNLIVDNDDNKPPQDASPILPPTPLLPPAPPSKKSPPVTPQKTVKPPVEPSVVNTEVVEKSPRKEFKNIPSRPIPAARPSLKPRPPGKPRLDTLPPKPDIPVKKASLTTEPLLSCLSIDRSVLKPELHNVAETLESLDQVLKNLISLAHNRQSENFGDKSNDCLSLCNELVDRVSSYRDSIGPVARMKVNRHLTNIESGVNDFTNLAKNLPRIPTATDLEKVGKTLKALCEWLAGLSTSLSSL